MTIKDDLIKSIHETTAIPLVSVKALKTLRDPEASMSHIIECFKYDPGLTANIIKLANSPLFATAIPVKTLQDAIIRIGFRQTLQYLIGISFAPILKKPVSGYNMDSGKLWESAISGAVFAEIMSKNLKLKIPDLLFTCCMLRDIGKMVIGSFLENNIQKIMSEARDSAISFEIAERNVLGIDHCEAGAILMERWKMPMEFIAAARWHHSPAEYKGDSAVAQIIKTVHVADIFSSISGDNDGLDGLNYNLDNNVAQEFKIDCEISDKIIYEHELKISELKTTGII